MPAVRLTDLTALVSRGRLGFISSQITTCHECGLALSIHLSLERLLLSFLPFALFCEARLFALTLLLFDLLFQLLGEVLLGPVNKLLK